MGSANSKKLDFSEVEDISKATGFSSKQIQRLYNRFIALDKDDNGYLSRQNLLLIPELAINPLAERIVGEFFKNCGEELNFKEFVHKLAIFRKSPPEHESPNSKEAKLRFLFDLYDTDQDECIRMGELLDMLQMMVGANISDDQMSNIADRTMLEADNDKDGLISYEEFKEAFTQIDIDLKMSIKFLE